MQIYRLKTNLKFAIKLLRSNSQQRHTLRWLQSLKKDYLFSEPSPWITFDAILKIKESLRSDWRVFEYGSGGSTLFWLNYGLRTVSIEHDPDWYYLVKSRLGNHPLLDYRLVTPEPIQRVDTKDAPNAADPASYFSAQEDYRELRFHRYVAQIDEFADAYFDLVLVDGRARPSCIKHAVTKIKPGGILVLDNADRGYYTEQAKRYLEGFQVLRFWGAVPTLPMYTQTNIYWKQ